MYFNSSIFVKYYFRFTEINVDNLYILKNKKRIIS